MMPGGLMHVYLGSLAGDLALLGSEIANAPAMNGGSTCSVWSLR
ncbi:MAG: hypothetical protein R2864_10145 [Syntrophotaleaceae bacterium]